MKTFSILFVGFLAFTVAVGQTPTAEFGTEFGTGDSWMDRIAEFRANRAALLEKVKDYVKAYLTDSTDGELKQDIVDFISEIPEGIKEKMVAFIKEKFETEGDLEQDTTLDALKDKTRECAASDDETIKEKIVGVLMGLPQEAKDSIKEYLANTEGGSLPLLKGIAKYLWAKKGEMM